MASVATLYYPVGVAIGLASAAPVGPVNLLVIQRTLTSIGGGLLLGLGGAAGDGVFAVVAAFGIGAVEALLKAYGGWIRLGGAAIMLAFAGFIWRAAPRLRDGEAAGSTLRMMLATFTLTLTNPATLLFFAGAFGAVGFVGIGHDSAAHRFNAALVVAGTVSGSMLWWLAVTGVARRLRGRLTDAHLTRLNKVTAAALALFAAATVVTDAGPR